MPSAAYPVACGLFYPLPCGSGHPASPQGTRLRRSGRFSRPSWWPSL